MSTRLTNSQTQHIKHARYGKASCWLFMLALLGFAATTLLESSLAGLSLTMERWLGVLMLVLPAAIGVCLALRGLFGGDELKRWAVAGLVLNLPFALFFVLVLAIAG